MILYGSSRLGIWNRNTDVVSPPTGEITNFERGNKFFELSNHLGNVLVTVSDRKLQVSAGGVNVDYYTADVVSATDYYPGGMDMPGRQYNATTGYRYGFNGKEKDTESPVQYDYGFRIYDPRLMRFKSVDPLSKDYPSWSPYPFAMNRPIDGIDIDGLEWGKYWVYKAKEISGKSSIQQADFKTPKQTPLNCFISGIKDSYQDSKQSISPKAIKSGWQNFKGLLNDIAGMASGDGEAISSFSNRAFNVSMAVAQPVTEPVKFVGTMHTRSLSENMYGLGYFGFQFGAAVLSERLIGSINGSGVAVMPAYEGNQIIRNALRRGARINVVVGEEAALMQALNKQAGIRWLGNGQADIQIMHNAARPAILEEAIHYEQYLKYGEDYMSNPSNLHKLEIEAKDRLLQIGKNENWTEAEINSIKAEKASHEREMKKKTN